MKTIFVIFISFICINLSYALDFKLRAREHYQIHTLDFNGIKGEYTGFSPSINLWWEDPYKLSYGFVIKPGLGKYKKNHSNNLGIDSFRLYKLGYELKYFPQVFINQLFFRLGLGLSTFSSDSTKDFYGIHFYSGVGIEFPIGIFGFAIEAAYQLTLLKEDIKLKTFLPSIGLHFYKLF